MKQKRQGANLNIRLIEKNDNAVVAKIIRLVMTKSGAVGCEYSINDSEYATGTAPLWKTRIQIPGQAKGKHRSFKLRDLDGERTLNHHLNNTAPAGLWKVNTESGYFGHKLRVHE